jgi:long-chain acyl-CoA synthetase
MTTTQSLDEVTQAKINAARTLRGIAPTTYRVPFRNIRDVLALHTKASPHKPYLVYYDRDGQRTELTYADFTAKAHQVANFLYEDLSIRRGDRVATIGYNHTHTVLIYMACWIVGAAVAPQNVAESDDQIAFILRNSKARVVFAMHDVLDRAATIVNGGDGSAGELGAPNVQGIIQVGGTAGDIYPHFETVVANRPTSFLGDESGAKGDDLPTRQGTLATATLDDDALLVYTSGTTGAPKGVVLNQYNLLADAQAISSWQAITGNQTMMCVLPTHHVNGIVVTLVTPLYVGATTVLNRSFSVSHFWERVYKEKVNVVSVVPTLLQFLLEYGQAQQADGGTIFGQNINRQMLKHFRHFICGAGTLAVALARAFENTFGMPILHGYGLSETTCYSCFLPITLSWETHQAWMQDYGYPSIGCPIDANEMAIFDPTGSGEQLGAGERGEICIRGHNVMQHYYLRPDANAETFKFGWFRSGDEGFYQIGADGRPYFFITGRIKELINRGGVKFSPFDIEEVLLDIDGVKVGLAVAFPNTYYGEEVGAYIVLEDGATVSAEHILDVCRQQMTVEKAPKVVVFGTDVPVTSTGKYQRLKLRDRFAEYEDTQFRK